MTSQQAKNSLGTTESQTVDMNGLTKQSSVEITATKGYGRKESRNISDISVIVGFLVNFVSSPLIVFLNKLAYRRSEITGYTLTCIHFIMTSLLLMVCLAFKIFEYKEIKIIKVLPLSITFCGFVVFNNLSLQFNTIGTYTVLKTLTTPVIIGIHFFFYHRRTSFRIITTTIPIVIGVFLNSYYDVKFSIVGIIFASIGVMVTSLYQVWVGEKQHEFQVNSMQLLFYQAPLSALLLIIVIPFLEPLTSLANMFNVWPWETMAVVLASGVVAFSVNLSIYWIIGNTSPVTYNMVGHLKFCLTLVGGFVLFNDTLNFLQICGILTTLTGVVAYTHFKMKENKQAPSLPSTNESKS